MTISIDDRPTCFGVNWNVGLTTAENQFKQWGFVNITDFKILKVLNGNTARNEVIAEAKKQDKKYFFKGSYDWGITADSAIYEFTYDIFTGDLKPGNKYMANWDGKSNE